jgi:hypothetical protein
MVDSPAANLDFGADDPDRRAGKTVRGNGARGGLRQ